MSWSSLMNAVRGAFPARVEGQVHRVLGVTAEGRGLFAPIGSACEIICRDGARVPAEVIALHQDLAVVAPCGDVRGVSAGDRILYSGRRASLRVGAGLIGRVIDAQGDALDGLGPLREPRLTAPLHHPRESHLLARTPHRVFVTGIRSLDSLHTVGCGQRLGILASSGVGTSTLLGMLARHSAASVVVIGLVGVRSREVREFVEMSLGEESQRRCVVVASTTEEPALRRIQSAFAAATVAEFFAQRGHDTLLLIDSLTRVAMSHRELSLSCGEAPGVDGFPASVFAALSSLTERAGARSSGSITALYTIVSESEERNDPVSRFAKTSLDGQLCLSQELAGRGWYPALDPLASCSRAQSALVDASHLAASQSLKGHIARARQAEELLRGGGLVPAIDPAVDDSMAKWGAIEGFLRQRPDEPSGFEETLKGLRSLVEPAQRPLTRLVRQRGAR